MTIAEAIYLLSAATSLLAAFLLMRQYRTSRTRLLLWSTIAFLGLAVNNVLVYTELVLLPGAELASYRAFFGAAAMTALLYGLIWETRG